MARLCGDAPGLGPCLHDPLRRDAVFPTGRPCDGFCILTGSAKYRLGQIRKESKVVVEVGRVTVARGGLWRAGRKKEMHVCGR